MNRLKRATTGTVLAFLVGFGVSGCDDFLDVNEDPNSPETVRMSLMLPGMLIKFGHDLIGVEDMRYGNLIGPTGWGTEWLQQWSDNRDRHTYAQFQWYEVANFDTGEFWGDVYADAMQECVNIMNAAEETEDWAFHGIAKFMFAWSAAVVSDAFGPVPLSEAFDPTNPNPEYDSQQEVYTTVFQLIDEAIDEMQRPSTPPGAGDVVWGGDMAMWVKLANTVKARLHMRLVYAPGENTQNHAQAALTALAAGIRSPAEAPTIHYAGGTGNRQPWYLFEDQAPFERSRSSWYFIEKLKASGDPRLPIMADPAELECPVGTGYSRDDCVLATRTIYRGNMSGGDGEPDSAISRIGVFFTRDDADHVWFTYEDAKFLEAEALLITSGAGAADVAYREGIRANMVRLGVAQADIDAYVNAKPPLGSVANPLKELISEKFVANFLQAEVWHDFRRTGYPDDVPLVNPEERFLDAIPQRLRTPADEMQFNSDAVRNAGIDTGLPGMLNKVWWASGSPSGF